MTHDNIPLKTTGSSVNHGYRLTLICAPSHDDLTKYTSRLVENFPDLSEPTIVRRIESPLTYDQLLSELSLDQAATEIALVFCGHGESSRLLGPGAPLGAPGHNNAVDSFYDESHLHLGPRFMLAFCCSAAAGLGVSYDRKTHGRTFIGFKDDILILTEDGTYATCWRAILHRLASVIINTNDQARLEQAVREIYREALALFPPEKDNVHNWGLMMRGALLQQLDDIKVFLT